MNRTINMQAACLAVALSFVTVAGMHSLADSYRHDAQMALASAQPVAAAVVAATTPVVQQVVITGRRG